MTHNQITGAIIDAAIHIHRQLGPGLLEAVYRKVLAHELRQRGFPVVEEQPIPVVWQQIQLEIGFRADLIVNSLVIVEIKSIEAVAPVHKKQLLTYLRLAGRQVGLLINFNVDVLKDGICRIVNGLKES